MKEIHQLSIIPPITRRWRESEQVNVQLTGLPVIWVAVTFIWRACNILFTSPSEECHTIGHLFQLTNIDHHRVDGAEFVMIYDWF